MCVIVHPWLDLGDFTGSALGCLRDQSDRVEGREPQDPHTLRASMPIRRVGLTLLDRQQAVNEVGTEPVFSALAAHGVRWSSSSGKPQPKWAYGTQASGSGPVSADCLMLVTAWWRVVATVARIVLGEASSSR